MLTLLTTTQNRPDLLLECALSVAIQSGKFEWIIVIDDEFYKYKKVIAFIKKWLPQTQVYCYGKIGRNQALIKGHELVKTSHVAWLDDDDLLDISAISTLNNYLQFDFVYTDYCVINKRGNIDFKLNECGSIFHLTMYSMDLFNLCCGINPSYDSSIDYELRLRLREWAIPIHIPKPLYYYRVHDDRMSVKFRDSQKSNVIRAEKEARYRKLLRLENEFVEG
jgi:glycosyltransferase involved in cell wall biosynthesis